MGLIPLISWKMWGWDGLVWDVLLAETPQNSHEALSEGSSFHQPVSLGIIKNCSAVWKKLDSITSNCSILLFQILIKHKNCVFNFSSVPGKHLEKTSKSQKRKIFQKVKWE